MNNYWLIYIIYAICGIYMVLNFKRDIHAFQLNSYRIKRYWHWLNESNIMTTWRLIDVALLFLILSTLLLPALNAMIVALVLACKCVKIFTAKFKKPLVFTKRVWRLYTCVAIISIIAFVCVAIWGGSTGLWGAADKYSPQVPIAFLLLLSIFSWVILMLAAVIMTPIEKHINHGFYKDAQRILNGMPDLKVVGITGSFGKTSTKHYLYRILSEQFDTLMTPGSFNTPMGVIRTIREQMKPYNQIFICEMGAKQKGDIKEICDLVHPDYGIITAVGEMHLETFKSIENVQSTKFELADALPASGVVVVNNDFEYCANRAVSNVEAIRYAVSNPAYADFVATDIEYSPTGTKFKIKGKDNFELELHSHLIGECNISNLVAAVIMALQLGVTSERIKYAVEAIEQVEHRLNVKRTPGGVTIIDDAFNSNPQGSRMAVETLGRFNSGKRIVVTPGMIELGDRQYDLNAKFGEYIAENVDIAVIVGQYNRKAIVEGIKKNAEFSDDRIIIADSFAEAQKILAGILKSGDIILYENDLPDTFK